MDGFLNFFLVVSYHYIASMQIDFFGLIGGTKSRFTRVCRGHTDKTAKDGSETRRGDATGDSDQEQGQRGQCKLADLSQLYAFYSTAVVFSA